jgi:hypothetical protein
LKGRGGYFLLLILIGFGMMYASVYHDNRLWHGDAKTLNDHAITSDMTFSTFIGGSDDDTVDCIVVDDFNNTFIAGRTRSANISSGANVRFAYSGRGDYYVMKLNPSQEIEYLTYIGADGPEGSADLTPIGACSIDVDDLGRVYMTGTTDSYYFPRVNPWQDEFGGLGDCFALRLSPTGDSFQYSTFLAGHGLDLGTTIKVDASYNAYICGWTRSSDFPTMNAYDSSLGGNSDLFLLKLDSVGRLVFSTYIGGSGQESTEGTSSLFLDEDGNAYVIGLTNSPDLPVTNHEIEYNAPYTDLFFWKVDAGGAFLAGSYFGSPDGDEVGGICVDDLGYIYLAGTTMGAIPFNYSIGSNPTAFVAKFSNDGIFIRSTGFGGQDITHPLSFFIDDDHCAFISGYTYSSDFPLEDAIESTYDGLRDCFAVKLSSGGDRLLFSSYLGGSEEDTGFTILATPDHRIVIGGSSNSSDFESVDSLISAKEELTGFIVEFEDIWVDIPLTTSTITTTASTTMTTTSTVPDFSFTTTITPDSTLFLNNILMTGIVCELFILFLEVRHIRRNWYT